MPFKHLKVLISRRRHRKCRYLDFIESRLVLESRALCQLAQPVYAGEETKS